MTSTIKQQIQKEEGQLKQAMLTSDIGSLDNLLDMDLIFTTHTGQIITKRQDLDAHKSGLIKIEEINNSDELMQIHDETVIVSLKSEIKGLFNGERADGTFRFTRVWAKTSSGFWRVVAGHSSVIQN
jgi:ketosteroid isomerase-like protein